MCWNQCCDSWDCQSASRCLSRSLNDELLNNVSIQEEEENFGNCCRRDAWDCDCGCGNTCGCGFSRNACCGRNRCQNSQCGRG